MSDNFTLFPLLGGVGNSLLVHVNHQVTANGDDTVDGEKKSHTTTWDL